MSEIIGFRPLQSEKQFQGQPVDNQTGIIGLRPISDAQADSFEGQLSDLPDDFKADAEGIQQQVNAESDAIAAAKPSTFSQIVSAVTRPIADTTKAFSIGKQLSFIAGEPYTPTEDDWAWWVTMRLDKLNLQMFPNGRHYGTEWMTQQNAPEELLKTLRAEFESKFKGVPQGGRPPEERSAPLQVAAGAAQGVENFVGGTLNFFTSPAGLLAPQLAAIGPKTRATMAAVFAGDMAIGAKQNWERFYDASNKGDTKEASEAFTDAALGTLTAGLLGVGAYGSAKEAMRPQAKPIPPTTVDTTVDTGVAGSGVQRPMIAAPELRPKFELREGETWKQMNQRVIEFQKEQKLLTDFIEAEVVSTPESRILGAGQQPAALIENGRGPLITPKPVSNLERAGQLLRLARLQDNPILIEGANAAGEIIGERERNVRKNPEGGKVPALDKADPFSQLPEAYRPDPANDLWPQKVYNPKDPQQQREILQVALEKVLGIEKTDGPKPATSAETSLQSAPQPTLAGSTSASAAPPTTKPVATKPWEMRQRLQERSRSQVEPIPKAEPAPKDPTLPSMPAVENFKEVPDNHPAVVFWSSPDSASYARAKAAEAFPDNPVMAADVATEAHAHLYLTAGNMPSGRVGAKPWGMRVMSNYIMDKARGIQRERKRAEVVAEDAQSALETTPDTAMTPEQEVRMGELESALEKVTGGMDAAERAVYDSLRGESDLSFTDIAKQQGVSVATISRRAQEIRQRIARSLFQEGVDGADYIDIVEKLEEQAASAQPKGIGASARKRMKSGRDEGGFFNPSILAPLGRIIRGWMQAGASAARAVGHAVKLFGRRIFAPAVRIARAAGFGAPAEVLGRRRPMRPLDPYVPGAKASVSQATARHPGSIRRPANWAALDAMKKAGLDFLVNAGGKFESRVQEWTARWTTPLAEIEQRYSVADFKTGAKEFDRFFTLRESRDPVARPNINSMLPVTAAKASAKAASDAYYLTMSPAGKELVDWQRWVVSEMGSISRQLGVQVQERGGEWRLGNFVNENAPRRPAEWFKELVKDPQKNLAEFNQLKADMVRNGNASNLAEAEAMLYHDNLHDTSTLGFFANAEKARGKKLPDRVYRHDLKDFVEYVDRNAERLAQIEAFGQSLGGKADTIFEVARARTTDPKLQQAIQDLRNHYYRDPLTTVPGKLTRAASSVSTVAYMGLSGMTAFRNAMTAGLNSAVAFGVTPTTIHAGRVAFDLLESAAKTAINVMGGELKSARTKDSLAAQEIGAVMHDLRAASLMDLENSTARSVVGGSLVFNSMAERAGRMVTTGAAMTWLRHTRWFVSNRPGGYMARNRLAQLERYGYKGTKLQELLKGGPSAEAEWQRTAVNEVQFNYKAKNSSTLFDRSWAKVFGQFQKYGFMMSRFVDRNVVEPLTQKQGGKWTPNVAPLLRLLVGSVLVGEAYQELRDKLFNKPRKTASLEEIKFTASKDTVAGLKLLAQRASIDIIYGSGLGIIGDVAGYAYEFTDRGRFKNPLSPPLFNLAELVISPIAKRIQRGATLEGLGDDLESTMSRIPFFSQIMGGKDSLDKAGLTDKQEAALAEGEYVKAEARSMLARFGKEYGINRPSKFNASMAMLDENSAELDAIHRALLSGDSKGASEIMGRFIKESENKTKAINVLRGSIDRRNPLYSATAGVDTPEKAEAFIKWVRQFDPEKAKRFAKVYLRYRSASGQD